MWPTGKAMLHSVYDQPDAPAVQAQFDRLIDYLTDTLPAAEHLAGASTSCPSTPPRSEPMTYPP
jgi:putative transposase